MPCEVVGISQEEAYNPLVALVTGLISLKKEKGSAKKQETGGKQVLTSKHATQSLRCSSGGKFTCRILIFTQEALYLRHPKIRDDSCFYDFQVDV